MSEILCIFLPQWLLTIPRRLSSTFENQAYFSKLIISSVGKPCIWNVVGHRINFGLCIRFVFMFIVKTFKVFSHQFYFSLRVSSWGYDSGISLSSILKLLPGCRACKLFHCFSTRSKHLLQTLANSKVFRTFHAEKWQILESLTTSLLSYTRLDGYQPEKNFF